MEKQDINYIQFESIPKILPKTVIYLLYCNKKCYIGSSTNFVERLKKHKSELINKKHFNKHIQRSFNKHGINKFKIFILEVLKNKISLKEISKKEEKYIKLLDAVETGFNQTYNTQTNFRNEKFIKDNTDRNKKKVVSLDLEGNYLKTYSSITEAALELGDQTTNISACCKGKLRFIKERIFVYETEYDVNKKYSLKPLNHDHLKDPDFITKMVEKLGTSIIVTKNKKSTTFKSISKFIQFLYNRKAGGTDCANIKNSIKNNTPFEGYYIVYENIV